MSAHFVEILAARIRTEYNFPHVELQSHQQIVQTLLALAEILRMRPVFQLLEHLDAGVQSSYSYRSAMLVRVVAFSVDISICGTAFETAQDGLQNVEFIAELGVELLSYSMLDESFGEESVGSVDIESDEVPDDPAY